MPHKHFDMLIEKYPNAQQIIKDICGFDMMHVHEYLFNESERKVDSQIIEDFILTLSKIVPEISFSGNLYDSLCCGIEELLNKCIHKNLVPYGFLFKNVDTIKSELLKQGIANIPDDIRQLFLFISMRKERGVLNAHGWSDLFNQYTSLSVKISLYYIHLEELLKTLMFRINKDKEDLQEKFNLHDYSIKSLMISLGDFHDVGHSVVKIEFENGTIIYKPRGAKNEELITGLLQRILKGNNDISIGIPRFINCCSYSWHEYISCSNPQGLREKIEYYQNIGASLFFFHLINGADLHYNNIIRVGSVPYFIDLECIISGGISTDLLSGTVLNTMIIPCLSGSLSDKYICGIAGGVAYDINEIMPYADPGGNPLDDCVNVFSYIVTDAILSGFDKMVAIVKKNITAFNILRDLNYFEGRVLFRSTRFYNDIISLSNHPLYASNPALRDCLIACALFNDEVCNQVIKHEYLAIREGRVPIFYLNPFDNHVHSSININFKVGNIFLSLKELRSKTYRMIRTTEEVLLQKELIKKSLHVIFPLANELSYQKHDVTSFTDFMIDNPMNYKGRIIYLNLKKDIHGTRVLSPMKSDIYSGLGGAVFLQLCNAISNPSLKNDNRLFSMYELCKINNTAKGIGCFEECGTFLYLEYLFLKHKPDYSNSSEFNRRLLIILNVIKNEKETPLDIISGVAGVLIICCRMYELSHSKLCLHAIKYLVGLFSRKAIATYEGAVTWGNGSTGFAHGNSGITYALFLANNIIKNAKLGKLIIHSLQYEGLFKIKDGWRKVSDKSLEGKDFNSWCHGSLGIYMSRKAMLDEKTLDQHYIDELVSLDIEHYKHTSDARVHNTHNSLCHGCYGNSIIDLDVYGKHFDPIFYEPMEDKSLMHGRAGAIYVNLFYENEPGVIPNILLLK
ncbi:DUF4135 domain-containing protein [Lelliottia amnigena]